jgi:hypothetical protein
MPDLVENGTPVAVPPVIPPECFEDFEGFRETTLARFLEPEANSAFRTVGRYLYEMVLESFQFSLKEPEGSFRHLVRATVADLRHLQGLLAALGRERDQSDLNALESYISLQCGSYAERIGQVADQLEEDLQTAREME